MRVTRGAYYLTGAFKKVMWKYNGEQREKKVAARAAPRRCTFTPPLFGLGETEDLFVYVSLSAICTLFFVHPFSPSVFLPRPAASCSLPRPFDGAARCCTGYRLVRVHVRERASRPLRRTRAPAPRTISSRVCIGPPKANPIRGLATRSPLDSSRPLCFRSYGSCQ